MYLDEKGDDGVVEQALGLGEVLTERQRQYLREQIAAQGGGS